MFKYLRAGLLKDTARFRADQEPDLSQICQNGGTGIDAKMGAGASFKAVLLENYCNKLS
jgi:hypothetical protein